MDGMNSTSSRKRFLGKTLRLVVISACLVSWYTTNLFSGLRYANSDDSNYETIIRSSDLPIAANNSSSTTNQEDSVDLGSNTTSTTSQQPQPPSFNMSVAIKEAPICRDVIVGREPYVCQGPEYDAYADRLEQFVAWAFANGTLSTAPSFFPEKEIARQALRDSKRKSPLWGRRPYPFLANSTILAVGQSHTRGIFQTIARQYPTLSYEQVEADPDNSTVQKGTYYRFEFANHAKVHLISNHGVLYITHWQPYMEDMIGMKLKDLDAIVLGKSLEFKEAVNTTFMNKMLDQTSKLKDADFRTIPSPALKEFAEAYSGPIVAHSLIASWGLYSMSADFFTHWRTKIKHKDPERAKLIRVVRGRLFSPLLGDCATDQWRQAGICENNKARHACVGKRGGPGDLVAWEIIEHLYDLWEKNA
jgi:hypothetical protein